MTRWRLMVVVGLVLALLAGCVASGQRASPPADRTRTAGSSEPAEPETLGIGTGTAYPPIATVPLSFPNVAMTADDAHHLGRPTAVRALAGTVWVAKKAPPMLGTTYAEPQPFDFQDQALPADARGNEVLAIDPETSRVKARWSVAEPTLIDAFGSVWFPSRTSCLTRVDPVSLAATEVPGPGSPDTAIGCRGVLGVGPDALWVQAGSTLHRIDPRTNLMIAGPSLPSFDGATVTSVAVTKGALLIASTRTTGAEPPRHSVTRLDLVSGATTYDVPRRASVLAVSDTRAWAAVEPPCLSPTRCADRAGPTLGTLVRFDDGDTAASVTTPIAALDPAAGTFTYAILDGHADGGLDTTTFQFVDGRTASAHVRRDADTGAVLSTGEVVRVENRSPVPSPYESPRGDAPYVSTAVQRAVETADPVAPGWSYRITPNTAVAGVPAWRLEHVRTDG